MIPRTKANYTAAELMQAATVSEKSGRFKQELTRLLQQYTGEQHILLTPSGRGGLYFILRATDRPRVLVPAYTCKAVIEAILLAGKTPVHIEVESGGFNVDLTALERELDEHSIVLATHQFGIPCGIGEIVKMAAERHALVIEDAAASLGTRVDGQLTGTFGDAAFFSFDSTKLVNVPMKGGFIIVKDGELFRRVAREYANGTSPMPQGRKWALLFQAFVLLLIEQPLLYRLFHWLMFELRGRVTQDSSTLVLRLGAYYQYDFAEWQAYIAYKQIARIDALIDKRRLLYAEYTSSLSGFDSIQLPPPDAASEWACVRFPVRVRGDKLAYYGRAARRGIDFAFSFTYLACPRGFDRAWGIADSVLDLPFYPKLTRSEFNSVVRVLADLERSAVDGNR